VILLQLFFFFIERKNLFHLRIVLNLFLWSWFGALSDSLATFFFFIERKNLFHLRIVLNLFLWSWFGF